MSQINVTSIPQELKDKKQWVLHKNKIPYQIDGLTMAKSNDSNTWASFDDALESVMALDGFGLSFALNNDYIGIDLDNCLDLEKNKVKDWAKDILDNLKEGYVERSLSGKGVHIFMKKQRVLKHKDKTQVNFKLGKYEQMFKYLPNDIVSRIKQDKKDIPKDAIEIYYKNRFLTVTGEGSNRATEIKSNQEYIEQLFKQLVEIDTANDVTKKKKKGHEDFQAVKVSVSMDDILDMYGVKINGNQTICPFHGENIPSLYIYQLTDSFYCFGCNKGGDIFTFVQLKENLDSLGALKFIAKKFNIQLKNVITSDSKIVTENGCYFYNTGESLDKITNFVIEPVKYIELADFSIEVNIKIDHNTYNIIMPVLDFENKQTFKKAIHKYTMGRGSFYGSETHVEYIKDLVTIDLKTVKGVDMSGIHKDNEEYFFIDNNSKILSINGVDDEYILHNNRNKIESNILDDKEVCNISKYVKLIENILNVNKKETMITLLCYMSACFFKTRLFENKIKFPHYNLSAESSTGKSTIKDFIIYPFFSLLSDESVSSTRFPLNCAISSNNTIPLVLDEFKYSKFDNRRKTMWSEINRLAFEGLTYSRGKINLSSDNFKYVAPLIFLGESSFTDLADKNRCIDSYTMRYIDNDDLKRLNNSIDYLIENTENLKALGRMLLEKSLKISSKEVKESFLIYKNKIKSLQPRNRENTAVILTGLKLLVEFFNDNDFDIYQILGEEAEVIKAIEKLQFDVNQGGKNFTLSIVPKILEKLDLMYDMDLINKSHVTKKSGNLAINLKLAFPEFTKFVRDYNVETEIISYEQFTIQIRNSPYFIDYNNARFENQWDKTKAKTCKAFIINSEMLKNDGICENLIEALGL